MVKDQKLKHRSLEKSPTPEMIKEARSLSGLTQEEAAEKIRATLRAWQGWEQGVSKMHPGLWDYFLLVTGLCSNPKFRVAS